MALKSQQELSPEHQPFRQTDSETPVRDVFDMAKTGLQIHHGRVIFSHARYARGHYPMGVENTRP
jgi:hypothetical protein